MVNIKYNNFKINSCSEVSPAISLEHWGKVRSRFNMNMIHCPKFFRALPFRIRTCITAFVTGSASGDGGELEPFGNALTDVSVFIVTMNCSFNASCHQQ